MELLTVMVDAELALGHVDAASTRHAPSRSARVISTSRRSRPVARPRDARALAAAGDLTDAIEMLEASLVRIDPGRLPWLRSVLLVGLARLRDASGDTAGATLDAEAAAATLATLDVVVDLADAELLDRLCRDGRRAGGAARTALLTRDGAKWWTASSGGAQARLPDTKGLAYLAELIAHPGSERHAFDLVDRVEGVGTDGRSRPPRPGRCGRLARRAGAARVPPPGRAAPGRGRRRIAAGLLETAEAKQAELDELVAELARAFGLGGRDRRAASAAERARLNVTRALRAAIARLTEALPGAGEVLDRRVRTGLYCAYVPADDDEVRWIVQS